MSRSTLMSAAAGALVLGFVTCVFGQTASTTPPATVPSTVPAATYVSGDSPATDAEREKIWNSPTMLRARAWVQEYCARSAKITPAEAQQYMTELSRLSPTQMKLWLLKFEDEEASIRQHQADFNRARQAGVAQAGAIDQATQTAYANINRDETEAAQGAEQSLQTEQQEANERDLQNDQARDAVSIQDVNGPLGYGPYGYGMGYPYGGYNPLGGYHVHVHVHPQ